MTRADGSNETVRYGAAGVMLDRQDANAQVLSYQRDTHGRIIRTTDTLGRSTRNVYDAEGNVTRRIDALGHITDISYDPRWNKPTIITRYDSDGSPTITQLAYHSTTGYL